MRAVVILMMVTVATMGASWHQPVPAVLETEVRLYHDRHFDETVTGSAADALREGETQHRAGRVSEALRFYMEAEALAEEPTGVIPNRLGRVYQSLGKHRTAAAFFGRAVAANDNPVARWNRALARRASGDCRGAVEDAERLLEMETRRVVGALTWARAEWMATTKVGAHYVIADCHAPDVNAAWWQENEGPSLTPTGSLGLGSGIGQEQSAARVSACHSAFLHWPKGEAPMVVRTGEDPRGVAGPCANQWSSKKRKDAFVEHAGKGLGLATALYQKVCRDERDRCAFLRRYFQDGVAAGYLMPVYQKQETEPNKGDVCVYPGQLKTDEGKMEPEEREAYRLLHGRSPATTTAPAWNDKVREYVECVRLGGKAR